MNCSACLKWILCVALFFGLTTARAEGEISARKLGGLEMGSVEENLMVSRDGKYFAMLYIPGEKGSDCNVFERVTHKMISVPGSTRMEPLVFSRDGSALWVWGLHRDVPLPGVKNIPQNAPFIALYDLPKRRFVRAFAGKENEWGVPSDAALSRDGSTLIVAWRDGWARAFNTQTGKQKWQRLAQDTGGAPAFITLSADGSQLLRSDDEGGTQSTQIVSTRSGKVIQLLRLQLADGMRSAFSSGRFAPRGDMVAVFQPDTQQWVFFDARTGKMKWKMGGPSDISEGDLNWQWSPDAKLVAVSGPKGFELRDARDGSTLRRVQNPKKAWGFSPGAIAFSPDGSLLFSLGANDTGFGADSAMWQLRLRGNSTQIQTDKVFMAKVRAEAERFALSPQHINQSLILAARRGDDRRVAFLLDKGANIETRDDRRETPLIIAVNGNDVYGGPNRYRETVQLLLKRGAAVKRDGGFLLASAAADGNNEIIRVLFKRGVSANADATAYGTKTALSASVGFGRVSTVQLLLENGASPNALSNKDSSPLWDLAYSNSTDGNEVSIARLLIDKGADLNARTPPGIYTDNGGETALGKAAWTTKTALVVFLLERGANPNIADAEGKTPLMQIAMWDSAMSDTPDAQRHADQLKMVRALLAHGAKLELRDKEKQSAFDMATSPKLKAALKIPIASAFSKQD